jgi:hypothetical protein
MALKRFPMRLNFWEILLTYGIITVPWYIVSEEGRTSVIRPNVCEVFLMILMFVLTLADGLCCLVYISHLALVLVP